MVPPGAAIIGEAQCDIGVDAVTFTVGDATHVWPYDELARADDGNSRIIFKRNPDTGERLAFEADAKEALKAAAPQLFTPQAHGVERPRVALGVVAAVRHNAWIDHALRFFTVGGVAIASFWFAIMLQLLFAMELNVLPLHGRIGAVTDAPARLTGLYLVDSLLTGRFDIFRDALAHLALPAVTLSFGSIATITRFTRSGVLETLQKEYVLYEAAAGYPRWLLIWVYVLRNSLVATITQIGLLFGALLAGAVVVESVFDWPGIGSYAVFAIFTSDYKAILAVTLLVGVVYALVNIVVDVIHGVVDPRVAEQL